MNRVQKRFLQSIGVTELEALANYKLAPLSARRDVAMRGLLLRVSHGLSFFGAARGGVRPRGLLKSATGGSWLSSECWGATPTS